MIGAMKTLLVGMHFIAQVFTFLMNWTKNKEFTTKLFCYNFLTRCDAFELKVLKNLAMYLKRQSLLHSGQDEEVSESIQHNITRLVNRIGRNGQEYHRKNTL